MGQARCTLRVHGLDCPNEVGLLRTALAQNGVFHLWGHSWELEESQQWSRLEDVLKLMSELRKSAPCLSNWQVITALRAAA